MNRVLKSLLLFLPSLAGNAYSQPSKTGTWGVLTVTLPSNTDHRFGGYFETQARTERLLFNKFFYNEFKTGISYAIDNNYVALVGTGRYTTYDYTDIGKGPTTRENRVWEQLTFTQYLNRIKFEHRYRAEQRWINEVYHNRFRYRLNAVVPLNNKKILPETFFISVFDEIFLNNKQPNFARNRIAASLGYQFSPSFTLQAGWLNQYNNTLSGTNDKNNLLFNFVYLIRRNKPAAHEELPTIKD